MWLHPVTQQLNPAHRSQHVCIHHAFDCLRPGLLQACRIRHPHWQIPVPVDLWRAARALKTPKGAMSVQPEESNLNNEENTHENGVDTEDANIFWIQGERYSRTPADQTSTGARPHHRPPSGAPPRHRPSNRNESRGRWQESPRKPSGANPMLVASKERQRNNESATRVHEDICNRCGGEGHHSTVCPSAKKAAPVYGMSVEPLSDT